MQKKNKKTPPTVQPLSQPKMRGAKIFLNLVCPRERAARGRDAALSRRDQLDSETVQKVWGLAVIVSIMGPSILRSGSLIWRT